MKKYKYEELCDIYDKGEAPWWIIGNNHSTMFYTAVYHQMMANMCLNNEYHPDYAGGVVDKWMFKYYENAHDLIYWKTYRSGPKDEE
tara:strand:+ start:21 stop:281 length:261 start_codon:yes stop_codon:yes gene_type:complete